MNKFNVGDKVKVKDFYDIAVTLDKGHRTHNLLFSKEMLDLCGKTFIISHIRAGYTTTNEKEVIELEGTGYVFVEEWLELVDLKCTLEDVFEYDSELADFFADQIRDEYNIIICDIDHAIFDEDLHENTTYVTKQAKDIVLKFDSKHPSVDEWHTHAVIFEGYGYIDCVCSSCVADILRKKTP